jgi:hypothetical protein
MVKCRRLKTRGAFAMTQIILDTNVCGKLTALTHPVELCDASGRVLGRFVPRIDMSEWEPVSPAASEEELDRREQAGEKRYSTAEVLAYLEKLSCSE